MPGKLVVVFVKCIQEQRISFFILFFLHFVAFYFVLEYD